MQNKPAVGVIGLGIMGLAMAKNAQAAGFRVSTFNRSAERANKARALNLNVLASARAVADQSDAVIVMVTDPPAVRAVLEGPTGILSGDVVGKTLIQMSTIDETSTMIFAKMAADKRMSYIDCPVTGSKKQVEEAQLILLAGGDAALIETWGDLFRALGKTVVHAGGIGKGTALKLCMNLIVAQLTTAICEAVSLAKAQAVDAGKIFEVISHSPALNCGYFKIKEKALLTEDFSPAFSLGNMLKDVRFMDLAADAHGLRLPVTQAVKVLMEEAVEAGFGADDLTSIARVLTPALN